MIPIGGDCKLGAAAQKVKEKKSKILNLFLVNDEAIEMYSIFTTEFISLFDKPFFPLFSVHEVLFMSVCFSVCLCAH